MSEQRLAVLSPKRSKPSRPHTPYDLVMVEWEDSQQPLPAWQWVDDYRVPTVTRCVSVGFLIAETKDAIAVAPNLGDVTKERVQASGIMRIPASAVRKIVRL